MFKVGDEVFVFGDGWGVVVSEKSRTLGYPISVCMNGSGRVKDFMEDGRMFAGECRMLFFDEIHIPRSAVDIPLREGKILDTTNKSLLIKNTELNDFEIV